MCSGIVHRRDKNISLILHFVTNSAGSFMYSVLEWPSCAVKHLFLWCKHRVVTPSNLLSFTFSQQRLPASSSWTYSL